MINALMATIYEIFYAPVTWAATITFGFYFAVAAVTAIENIFDV
jgi:hypothetical protein